MAIHQGTRVATPGGLGTVAYVRMAPPDYQAPAAVSVVLDAHRMQALEAWGPSHYQGTIYPAHAVLELETPETRTVAYACDHTGPEPADPLAAWGVCPACQAARR